jgi:hypothetical protein
MTIKQLVHNGCANYFGELNKIQNYCCLHDKGCLFFNDNNDEEHVRCKYFEDSVFPLNPDLQFRYRKERQLSTVALVRTCKRCLQPFTGSTKEKYCGECKKIRKREQTKLSVRKLRKAI